jgi:hypothetical protein
MPRTVAGAATCATAIPSGPGVLVGEHRFSCFAWAAIPDRENQGHKRRYGLNSLSTPLPIWSINLYGKSPPFRHTFRERAGQTFA